MYTISPTVNHNGVDSRTYKAIYMDKINPVGGLEQAVHMVEHDLDLSGSIKDSVLKSLAAGIDVQIDTPSGAFYITCGVESS